MKLRRSSHYGGFKSNSERDIKSVFQTDVANNLSELMRNFRKHAIKYILGLRHFLFFTSKTQNIWCQAYSKRQILGGLTFLLPFSK